MLKAIGLSWVHLFATEVEVFVFRVADGPAAGIVVEIRESKNLGGLALL